MKKTNNKGFSLVELIVVVAIMAVLIGVLAPQFLRYVEKSRIQKDNTSIGEICNAAKIAMADETINATPGTMTFTAANGVFTFGTTGKLETEIGKVVGDSAHKVTLTSNAYTGTDQPVITVAKTADSVTVTVTKYVENDGTKVASKVF